MNLSNHCQGIPSFHPFNFWTPIAAYACPCMKRKPSENEHALSNATQTLHVSRQIRSADGLQGNHATYRRLSITPPMPITGLLLTVWSCSSLPSTRWSKSSIRDRTGADDETVRKSGQWRKVLWTKRKKILQRRRLSPQFPWNRIRRRWSKWRKKPEPSITWHYLFVFLPETASSHVVWDFSDFRALSLR